jgi:DNA-binding XRE family transcriptional regulator
MTLQKISSLDGKIEYVLLPFAVYRALQPRIDKEISKMNTRDNQHKNEYVAFDPADYVDNPVTLARMRAGLTQGQLAKRLGVSQAYVSKIENQMKVSTKVLMRVNEALKRSARKVS